MRSSDLPVPDPSCVFCRLIAAPDTDLVASTPDTVAFLDRSPLFPGHCLVVPRAHWPTLMALPPDLVEPLFTEARRVALTVQAVCQAQGVFVGINNTVSQSVPHLHVHVVPRNRGDGLKGFFWPRQRYAGPEAMADMAQRLRTALDRIRPNPEPQGESR